MKTIQLSVPKPCHENWDAMTPDEKGRFCDSCQKSVVDFSEMSDRQLAEFFKKPVGSVCGRFHNDQLNREISLPQKRIPWLRYFFTVSLPAFLASCEDRAEVVGKLRVVTEQRTVGDTILVPPPPVMGMMTEEILPEDSTVKKTASPKEKLVELSTYTVGELGPPVIEQCTATVEAPPPGDTAAKETVPMDTVNVTAYPSQSKHYTMGGLMSSVQITKSWQADLVRPDAMELLEVVAYPNPVRAGGVLTVGLPATADAPTQFQLLSAAGALVNAQRNLSVKSGSLSVAVPSSLPAGTYFLRLVWTGGRNKTVKIVVLN